jgi:hypothetical protein
MRSVRPFAALRPRYAPRSGFVPLVAAAALCVALPWPARDAGAAQRQPGDNKAQQLYKWVDENGVTHYGDAIPPQYADQDKTVMNSQGIPVGSIAGRRTPEQLEAAARARAAENRQQQEKLMARQRDTNLLATYLSVDEIESLRDRRLEILEAQAKVTNQYLDTLRQRLRAFETQATRFRPFNTEDRAAPLPEHLADDLVRTVNEIRSQERNLESKKQEALRMQDQFGRDIARFKELKKIEAEYLRSAQPRG